MRTHTSRVETGFTLIEIAIVLVIIGLLLGAVQKGQELINSGKAKAVMADFRNAATMLSAFQDRFRALPGDDAQASNHLAGAANAASASGQTPGNGNIEGLWNSTSASDESVILWQHLRLANLATGDTTAPASASDLNSWLPRNQEGGRIGIQSGPLISNWSGRQFICQDNISGRVAQQVDSNMDDGAPSTGSIRFGAMSGNSLVPTTVSNSASSSVSGSFSESGSYAVCMSF
jgi:prepilin-type N-terminal cleavage/methylation domain-containing protein